MVIADRTKWAVCYAILGALVLVGGLAGAARSSGPSNDDAPIEAARRGAQSNDGQPVFDRVCGRCHPHGNEDIGPRIVNKNFDEARMVKQIRNGTGRMRAIPPTKLPEAQMPALIGYLRSIHAVR